MSVTYSKHRNLLDGEVSIFVLASAIKGKWQVKFRNPLGDRPRYIRKSTGHTNETLATKKALDIYQEYQTRRLLGLTRGTLSIQQLFNEYEGSMTKVMREMTFLKLNKYWNPYFKNTDFSTLSSSDIEAYFKWRVDEYVSRDIDTEDKFGWKASDTSISFHHLQAEASCLRWLLNQAFKKNLLPKQLSIPDGMKNWSGVHKLPDNFRRGRFTKSQYRKLTDHFRSVSFGLQKNEWKPVLQNPSLPFHPVTNCWQSRAQHEGKTGSDKRNKTYTSKSRRYTKAIFWFASLMLSNTGIRVSDLVKIKHKHIKLVRDNDDGQLYTVITIPKTVSKIRKFRQAISADGPATYKRYLIYKKELEYYFNQTITDDDWLFPKKHMPNEYVASSNSLGEQFRYSLKALDLHSGHVEAHTTNGPVMVKVYYSAYSFRSWYITQRLANHLDPYTISKNCGVGIATLIKSYDVNETWAFRKQMTSHINSKINIRQTDNDETLLAAHIEQW